MQDLIQYKWIQHIKEELDWYKTATFPPERDFIIVTVNWIKLLCDCNKNTGICTDSSHVHSKSLERQRGHGHDEEEEEVTEGTFTICNQTKSMLDLHTLQPPPPILSLFNFLPSVTMHDQHTDGRIRERERERAIERERSNDFLPSLSIHSKLPFPTGPLCVCMCARVRE